MSLLPMIARALVLIILAALIYLGVAMALDVGALAAPQEQCAGQTLPACFLAII